MKNDTVGAATQNGEDNLDLLAATAEKVGNEDPRHEVPEQTEKRQAGVNLPQKRDRDVTAMGMAKRDGASGSRLPPKKRGDLRGDFPEINGPFDGPPDEVNRASRSASRTFPNFMGSQNGEENLLLLACVADAFGNDDHETMPMELKEKIMELRGSDVKMVMEKELTGTDLGSNYGRLNITKGNSSVVEFLTKEEQENLEKRNGRNCESMKVLLIEPNLNESSIYLSRWKIGKDKSYVLCKTWTKVAERNKLNEGNTVQVWSFRVSGSLGLALVKLQN